MALDWPARRESLAYWDGGFAIFDISDRADPELITHQRTFRRCRTGTRIPASRCSIATS